MTITVSSERSGPKGDAVTDQERLVQLGNTFSSFAREAYLGVSALYTALARGVSEDSDMLSIASSARQPPVPNLLFAAVHYLLLRGAPHELSSYYLSLTREPRPPNDAYPSFRDFCQHHESEIRSLMSTRLVQTNEVARCSYMVPAFAMIAEERPGLPLSHVDVGASAGLNLLWDRYAYDYGDAISTGDRSSPVRLEAEIRGDREPPIPDEFPTVVFRIGIDLNPIDVTDPDSALWLRALVWPEHQRRAGQLQAATRIAAVDPPAVVAGDVLTALSGVLDRAPVESTICVSHNHTLNQLSEEDRRRVYAIVEESSAGRELYVLSAEGRRGQSYATLELVRISGGVWSTQELAAVDHHGKWLEWVG